MQMTKTNRGFAYANFTDGNGVECSIQKSSRACEDEEYIWLGATEIGLQQLIPGRGWQKMELDPARSVANNRMHLTQSNVKELLPYLQYFAEHGELPEAVEESSLDIDGGSNRHA